MGCIDFLCFFLPFALTWRLRPWQQENTRIFFLLNIQPCHYLIRPCISERASEF